MLEHFGQISDKHPRSRQMMCADTRHRKRQPLMCADTPYRVTANVNGSSSRIEPIGIVFSTSRIARQAVVVCKHVIFADQPLGMISNFVCHLRTVRQRATLYASKPYGLPSGRIVR
jgi:hypothetical protein